jgi:capsular exopolysaccharide synthesis family protein
VLLIDGDLRRPSIARRADLNPDRGLTTVLIAAESAADVIQKWGTIDVLTAGVIAPNPTQLLDSEAMLRLMTQLTQDYDMIVIDSSSLLPVTDAFALARFGAAVLVVAEDGVTKRAQLAQTAGSLEATEAPYVGVVLNRTERDGDNRYGYSSMPRSRFGRMLARLNPGSKAAGAAGAVDWTPRLQPGDAPGRTRALPKPAPGNTRKPRTPRATAPKSASTAVSSPVAQSSTASVPLDGADDTGAETTPTDD